MSETTPEPLPPTDPVPPEPQPETRAEIRAEPVAAPAEATRRPLPVGGIFGIVAILLLLGAGGEYYLWHQEEAGQQQQTAALNGEIDALKSRVAQLSSQVAAEKTPPKPQVPAAVTDQINGLQQRVKTLAGRLDAGDAANSHLQSQVEPRLQALGSEVGSLKSRLGALDSNLNGLQGSLQSRIGAVEGRLTAMQSKLGDAETLAARAGRLDRLAMASLALQNGESLGPIKDAPPALARFATTAPPTEAELRQEFPAAAARATDAGGVVQSADHGYWQRLKMRVAGLVTVRKGDQVLIGSPVDGVIGAAKADLDAGNLQKAVDALQTLSPQAQAAMQGWLDQAKALLAARAALATMTEQG